jgi:hypothetical protein
MSLIGDSLNAGSSSVIPMLTEAGPGIPFFAPASGGGGGASTFTSSFNVSVAALTSTVLMDLPAGQFAYQGQMIYSGSETYTSGFINCLVNSSGPLYYGSQLAFPPDNNVPADSNPNGEISISDGGNPLSTIKVYAVNHAATATGAWLGVIGKIY